MRLVESEVPDHPPGDAPAPAPPRRRVAVSLTFTLAVLIGTVAVIYTVFPKRHHEILAIAIDNHLSPQPFELAHPTPGELRAWSVGHHRKPVPWPTLGSNVDIEGAYSLTIFRRAVALVRLRVDGEPVTLMAVPAREAIRRKRRLAEGDVIAYSWRVGRWTFVAVGNRVTADRWRRAVGAR